MLYKFDSSGFQMQSVSWLYIAIFIYTVGGTYSSLMIMSPLPHALQCWRPAGELNQKTQTQSNTNIARDGEGGQHNHVGRINSACGLKRRPNKCRKRSTQKRKMIFVAMTGDMMKTFSVS